MQQFSTFGTAVNTCFAILLGDISVNDDLNQLQGLQGVAATLFFWSFELLVFMVLLNFLLAIIVDAFSEVKENTHETTGMPPLPCWPELHTLLLDTLFGACCRCSMAMTLFETCPVLSDTTLDTTLAKCMLAAGWQMRQEPLLALASCTALSPAPSCCEAA